MSDAPQTTPKGMIARAIGPNDVGARGFLVWLRAALPDLYKSIEPQLKANSKATALSGLGRTFGDVSTSDAITLDVSLPQNVQDSLNMLPPAGGDVPASPAPASSGWGDMLSKLVAAWGQAKLTSNQLDAVQQMTNINIQRAKNGQAPLPIDPSQYGLAPTVNFGLAGGTQSLVMYGGIALLALLAFGMLKPKRA